MGGELNQGQVYNLTPNPLYPTPVPALCLVAL